MIVARSVQERGSAQQTLYVVFHGEIVFIDSGHKKPHDPILAIAPAIGGHVYQAGPWLGEQTIDAGSLLELKGVESGKQSVFDHRDKFVLFENVPGPTEKARWHYAILLPRPDEIIPGAMLTLKPGAISEIGPEGVKPSVPNGHDDFVAMDTHPIFKYRVSDSGDRPGLYRYGGNEVVNGPGKGACLSLHVFAEEDTSHDSGEHSQIAFQAVKEVLGIKAKLMKEPTESIVRPSLIPGLDPCEYTLPLAARREVLTRAGEGQRAGSSPDLAALFRELWEPGEMNAKGKLGVLWIPEGTCGSTGGSPSAGLRLEHFLKLSQ